MIITAPPDATKNVKNAKDCKINIFVATENEKMLRKYL